MSSIIIGAVTLPDEAAHTVDNWQAMARYHQILDDHGEGYDFSFIVEHVQRSTAYYVRTTNLDSITNQVEHWYDEKPSVPESIGNRRMIRSLWAELNGAPDA